ncbi:MAG: efflux RND transporter periplasmic adaptor subunit [Acidobacteriia bacterium]|nr:efflux RND transporter periplasmic adaptor subunit [Terriglobia bacterium]
MARQQNPEGSWHGRLNRLWVVLAAIVVGVIILAAFMSRRRELPVRAAKADRETITATIQTNGKIEPLNSFEAHAPAATAVKRVLVYEGEHVKAGQLLVELDDAGIRSQAARAQTQIRAAEADLNAVRSGGTREEVLTNQSQLATARTERDVAQRNLQALQELQKRGAASAGEVKDAENRLKSAQAQVSLLEQKLKSRYSGPEVAKVHAQQDEAKAAYAAAQELLQQSNVRAPHDGTVYYLPVHPGQFVATGELLVQVADLSKVQLRAFVDEPDIGRLQPGQPVAVTWDALPGQRWDGKVTRVPTTVVTLGTRNVGQFTCTVDNRAEQLLPNVNVNITIVTARHDNALTVPREAIHQDDGKRFVYQIVDGEVKRRDVQTSLSNLTRMEITQGLPDGAVVALNADTQQALKPGMSVRVVEE